MYINKLIYILILINMYYGINISNTGWWYNIAHIYIYNSFLYYPKKYFLQMILQCLYLWRIKLKNNFISLGNSRVCHFWKLWCLVTWRKVVENIKMAQWWWFSSFIYVFFPYLNKRQLEWIAVGHAKNIIMLWTFSVHSWPAMPIIFELDFFLLRYQELLPAIWELLSEIFNVQNTSK